ncbi:hypothetical protein DRF65_04550 [Chryseobacterium pennae]|uniref:Uncharacterized protein n=1 Tax=Chryseobacterium pennae TaxID=2258962 RepID=A0A3D9CDM4_9FLAO|nr:hypothetical protein [Chryseobacterium pennae]REC63973.1 hypothetical protein DRF65_04550 [Chryseobacterium pennae]
MKAKELIAKEIDTLNDLIHKGIDKESNIQLKKDLSDSIHLLDMFDRYEINKRTVDDIWSLPDFNTGYSDYRIINDCESDDPAQWIELSINNEKIRLSEGDIIIRKK